jgi:hypothetical protein
MSKKGLANSPIDVRKRVASSGGNAEHRSRGLATANEQDRRRVATMGGLARGRVIRRQKAQTLSYGS